MLFADVCSYDMYQQGLAELYYQPNLDPLKYTFENHSFSFFLPSFV